MITRRRLLSSVSLLAIPWLSSKSKTFSPRAFLSGSTSQIPANFPSQDPERVRRFVGVSHGNNAVVQDMLKESPALAKATVDWGFGDWETAIGAASHVGNREIAALLIDHGARPDLFTFAMLGQLEVVKAYIDLSPGIQKIRGPHGFTLMHHAKQGGKGSEAVVAFLEKVGDADIGPVSFRMTDDEKKKYVGIFTSEGEEAVRFEFSISQFGSVAIKRETYGISRDLNYIGNNEFAPIGADAVRVRFNAGLTECTIVDGPMKVALSRA